MATNRFMQPAQAEFINTYTPIPFDEMMKIGLMKQARIEKGLDQEDALRQSIGSMKVAPGDEKAFNSKIAEAYKILDEGTAYGVGTGDHLNAIRKARNFLVEDPDMRMMSQNYPEYAKAASRLSEARAMYGDNSPAVYESAKQLNEFNTGADGLTGTQYLMKKNGVGNLQAVGIGKPADIKPEIDEYLKPIKADMVGTQGLDASNMFIMGSKTTQVTPEKLGNVLGISFITISEKGRKKVIVDRENINPPADLDSKPGGMYLRQKAKQLAENSGGTLTAEEAYKQLYADDAVRAINANVSTQSEFAIDANPYALSKYNNDLKTIGYDSTSNVILSSAALNLKDKKSIDLALSAEDSKISQLKSEKEKLISSDNSKPVDIVDPVSKEVYKKYIDKNGTDITDLVRQKQLNIDEAIHRKDQINKMISEVKRNINIPEKFIPTEQQKKDAEAYAKAQAAQNNTTDPYATSKIGNIPVATKEELIQNYYENNAEYYKVLNKALKENSDKGSYNAEVTRFGDEKLNTIMDSHFNTAAVNQAFFNTDGTEVPTKERLTYSSLIFAPSKDKVGENGRWTEGPVWDNERGKYMIAYSVPTSDRKNPVKTILTEAPSQIVNIMIDRGLTNEAQQVIQQRISELYSDPNLETKLYLGKEDEPGTAFIRKIREDEKYLQGDKAEFIIELNIKEEDGVTRWNKRAYSDPTALGAFYESYRNAMRENAKIVSTVGK
jgi:hypothetical protein